MELRQEVALTSGSARAGAGFPFVMDVSATITGFFEGLAVSVGGVVVLLASGLAVLAMWRLIALALFTNYLRG